MLLCLYLINLLALLLLYLCSFIAAFIDLSLYSSIGQHTTTAVITVDGEQTHTTTVMKKTLNPYWNESFDM
jgi:hypothetical protein